MLISGLMNLPFEVVTAAIEIDDCITVIEVKFLIRHFPNYTSCRFPVVLSYHHNRHDRRGDWQFNNSPAMLIASR